VRKDDLRVGAYGEVDELNSALAWPRGAALAARRTSSPSSMRCRASCSRSAPSGHADADKAPASAAHPPEMVARMEKDIDRLTAELPEMRQFILPAARGRARAPSVRTVCRRAERERCSSRARRPSRRTCSPI